MGYTASSTSSENSTAIKLDPDSLRFSEEPLQNNLKNVLKLVACVREAEAALRFTNEEKEFINMKAVQAKECSDLALEIANEKLNHREMIKNVIKESIENETTKLNARILKIQSEKKNAVSEFQKIHQHLVKRLALAEEKQKAAGEEWKAIEHEIGLEVDEQERKLKKMKQRLSEIEKEEAKLKLEKESLDDRTEEADKFNAEVESFSQEVERIKFGLAQTLDAPGIEGLQNFKPPGTILKFKETSESRICNLASNNEQMSQFISSFSPKLDKTYTSLFSGHS